MLYPFYYKGEECSFYQSDTDSPLIMDRESYEPSPHLFKKMNVASKIVYAMA
jgi:dihydrofolate reductase